MRTSTYRRLGAAASLLFAAACTTATTTPTVATHDSSLGPILVDGAGRSLYLFEKDVSSSSTCVDECAAAWPPVTTGGAANAGTGVNAGLLATTARADHSAQVTYAGHPLYYYAGDSAAGDTHGQGLNQFGAGWYVLNPAGAKIDTD